MKVYESEEMYLETILSLKNKKSLVRSVDIVEELGYAKSSVSRAVNLLAKKNYIQIKSTGEIVLTAEGKAKAESIFERHQVLKKALIKMGAEENSAEENACRIEHVISDDIFEIIKQFVSIWHDQFIQSFWKKTKWRIPDWVYWICHFELVEKSLAMLVE